MASQLNLGKTGVSEITLTAKNASTNEGSAFAAYAANGATVDIKGKSLVASATTNKGKAGAGGVAYPEAAAGLFADGDKANANVNVTTTGLIDISATSTEGQAYGILAKGAAGSNATDNTKAGMVTINGGAVIVKANTTGDANRTYAVYADNQGLVTIGTDASKVQSLTATATAQKGYAAGLFAAGDIDKTEAKITANVAGKITARANVSNADAGDKAYGVYAKGKTGGKGTVTLNGRELEARAITNKGNAIGLSADTATTGSGEAKVEATLTGAVNVEAYTGAQVDAATGAVKKDASGKVLADGDGDGSNKAYGVHADGTSNKGTVELTTSKSLDVLAFSNGGKAYGIIAQGGANAAKEATVKINTTAGGGDVNVWAETVGTNAKQAYAVVAENQGTVTIGNAAADKYVNSVKAAAHATKGNAIGIFAKGNTNSTTADVKVYAKEITASAAVDDATKADGQLTNRAYAVYAKGETGTGTVNLTGDTLNATAIAKQGKAFGLFASGDNGTLTVNTTNKTVVNATSDVIAAGIAALGGNVTVTGGDLFVNTNNGGYNAKNNAILVNGNSTLSVGATGKTTQLVGDIAVVSVILCVLKKRYIIQGQL